MSEFFRGWRIIFAAIIGLALSVRIMFIYTFGLFSPPMMSEMGWSATQTQFSLTVFNVGGIISIVILSYVSKRLNLRSIIILSQLGMSAALLCIAVMPNSLIIFYTMSGIVAILGVGTLPMTWTKLVAHWFDKKRGLATGLALLGTGLGGSLLKPFTALVVTHFGWRGAFVGLALLPLVLSLPLVIAWVRTPNVDSDPDRIDVEHTGGSLSTTLRDWRFWFLGLSLIPAGATIGTLLVNSELILVKHGISAEQVVSITMLTGIFVIFGRVLGGYLLDHINAALLGTILLFVLLAACLLMTTNPISYYRAVIAIALLGMAAGVELDVISILCSRMFGLKNYVQIYGTAIALFLIGDAFGPVGFSYMAKQYDNLNVPLQAAAALLLVSIAMMARLSMINVKRST